MNRRSSHTVFDRIEHGTGARAVEGLGREVTQRASIAGRALLLFFDTCSQIPHWRRSSRAILRQLETAGVGSILVVCLIAFLTGMIMAVQTGIELEKFGVVDNLGAIIGATFVRELGPMWAAIIMLARIGAAMAAELGTMAVNEEIDALRVMNINPVRFLVMPRLIALVLAMPLLTVFADWVGMAGGAVVAHSLFHTSLDTYMNSAKGILGGVDFYSGLFKAGVFGAIICTIACDRGLNTHDGAEGVGRATNQTVVACVVAVLVANLVLTGFIQQILKPALS
jgi:phospholipid/cholesterol/gamma-HCH transport system permease protein